MRKTSHTLLSVVAVVMVATLASTHASAQGMAKSNQFWWPDQLDLSPLRAHGAGSNPMGGDFNYAAEFATLDLVAVK